MSNKRPEMSSRGRNQGRPKQLEERKIIIMKNRSSLTIFITILSAIGSFALLPEVKGAPEVTPPPDGGYPGLLQRKGLKRFKALPPALETQELAGERSLPTRLPASTPVLAPERYCSIRLTQIRQLAL